MSKRKKTWNTPKRHWGKVHPVGYYPGHLTKAVKRFRNILNEEPVTQMHGELAARMRKPKRMTEKEMSHAIDAGLEVNKTKGYIVGYE